MGYKPKDESDSPSTHLFLDDSASNADPAVETPILTVEDLVSRCEVLLEELQTFRTHLQSQKRENDVEIASYRSLVQAELASLKRHATGPPPASKHDESDAEEDEEDTETASGSTGRTPHKLRSSNLPFLEAVWATVKRSHQIVALSKRFYWHPDQKAVFKNSSKLKSPVQSNGNAKDRHFAKRFASVDIVANGGADWIKVSFTSETRLLFELASQGWPSSSESDAEDKINDTDEDDDDQISLIRIANSLKRASRATRYNYLHPHIHFVLPKVTAGRILQIDRILNTLRSTGITVTTANSLPSPQTPPLYNPPLTPQTLSTMTPDRNSNLTQTLNIDCTILLAIASDLSHTDPESLDRDAIPWHNFIHRAMQRQIERETKECLLEEVLWPTMGGRRLVCTEEAAQRMREIVGTLGTATEKRRTQLLLGDAQDGAAQDATASGREDRRVALVEELQTLSDHVIPTHLQIPIQILSKDYVHPAISSTQNSDRPEQPSEEVIAAVSAQLTPINQSVFIFGWRNGYTTLTSNKMVARQVERTIEEWLDNAEAHCGLGRGAVVGNEKGAVMDVENGMSKLAIFQKTNGTVMNSLEKSETPIHTSSDHDEPEAGLLDKCQEGLGAKETHEIKSYDHTPTSPTQRHLKRENTASEIVITGPNIWLCGTPRSLIGKEKGRK